MGPYSVDVATCTGSASFSQTLDTLAIADDFMSTFDTLEDFSGQTALLADAAAGALVNLAEHPDADATPSPFVFSNGNYTSAVTSQGTATLTAHFAFGQTYQAGNAGTLITPSLFLAPSYLVGATVSLQSFVATISYAQPGPLVELFGLGPTPPNPFKMAVTDPNDLGLQRLTSALADDETTARSTHVVTTATITRTAAFTDDTATALLAVQTSATRGTQTLTVTSAGLREGEDDSTIPAVPFVVGDVAFAVTGGTFAFKGTVTYDPTSHQRTLSLGCP